MSSDHSSKDVGNSTAAEPVPQEGAIQRWSRRKAAARTRTHDAPLADGTAGTTADRASNEVNAPAAAPIPNRTPPEAAPPELPALDRLDINADFTAFLREGVDPLLRRAALRKLWSLDPVFAELDGLVEYGEDFSNAGKASSVVHTAIRVTQEAIAFADETAGTRGLDDAAVAEAPSETTPQERTADQEGQAASQPAVSDAEGNKPRPQKQPKDLS